MIFIKELKRKLFGKHKDTGTGFLVLWVAAV